MGKNISVYCTDQTLANIDLIKEVWDQQDKEDGWPYSRSRSDIIAYAISVVFEIEVVKTKKLDDR